MTLRSDILDAQKEALKNHEEAKLATLRMLWSAIRNQEIDKGHTELKDDEIIKVVAQQIKQLKDAMADFERGGRNDLVEKTEKEMDFLGVYMPKQLSEEELKEVIKVVINNVGAKTPQDLGKVMGAVMKQTAGKADGNRVREIVNQLLGT
jgi:uncharacterized protein YqeY